jgi:hypothetical protein
MHYLVVARLTDNGQAFQTQYRRISVGRPWPSENKKQNNKQHKYAAANVHVELLLVARTLRVDR